MARPHPALIELAAGRPIPAVQDDQEILRSATEHRMHGLLWTAVRRGEVKVSRSTEQALAAEFLRTKARHKRFWETYEDISDRLGEEGIEFAAIKGVTAEARWYDEMGERPCRDVDLWLHPGHFDRIGDVLRVLDDSHPLENHIQDLVDKGYLQGLDFRLQSGVSVDVHTDPFKLGIRSRAAERMWQTTRPFESPTGVPIRVLGAEDSLVHFAIHLNVDRFSRLGRLMDPLRITQRSAIDWARVNRLASEEGLERPTLRSLEVALSALDGDTVPEVPLDFRSWLWEKLWPEKSRLAGVTSERWRFRQFGIPFVARQRSLEALRWLARRAFPPRELLTYVYPDSDLPYIWKVFSSRLRVQRAWRRRWSTRSDNSTAVDSHRRTRCRS